MIELFEKLRKLPTEEQIYSLRDHGHPEEAAYWLEERRRIQELIRRGDK